MMELVTLPEMSKGEWKVEHFKVEKFDMRAAFRGREVPLGGEYTRLMRNGTLVMSDTPAEQKDHYEAVEMARGVCLLNGLGIGLVLKNILLRPEVTEVTVVEISQDLIDLVSPYYDDPRVSFICCDALEYQPPKGKRYNMVWHDIWDYICSDNLKEMRILREKYRNYTDWQASWCEDRCLR
mgnify:CR=1 FL=1